jgi:hypothetical protein
MDFAGQIKYKQELIGRLMEIAEEIEKQGGISRKDADRKLLSDLSIAYKLDTDGTQEIEVIFEYIDKLENDIVRLHSAMSMR